MNLPDPLLEGERDAAQYKDVLMHRIGGGEALPEPRAAYLPGTGLL